MPLPAGTLELIAATPATLHALLGTLPDEAIEQRDTGGWSVRDVVAHMLAVEEPAFRDRIMLILEETNPTIPVVDEDATLEASGYRLLPLSWLLDEFERRRTADVAWFRSLDDLERGGQHPAVGEVTVGNVLSHLAHHDAAHLQQIAGILDATANTGRGNLRRLDA